MSHIVTVNVEMKNEEAIKAVALRSDMPGIQILGHGKHQLFGSTPEGLGVQLPDWRYPIVIDTVNGRVMYDNYNGSWGKQETLDQFTQLYGVEAARQAMEQNGYSCLEEALPGNEIKLTATVYA